MVIDDLAESSGGLIGQEVCGYCVQSFIDKGKYSRVFKAKHPKLERVVAVKQLKQEYWGFDEAKINFLEEARILCSLDHPNIVKAENFDEEKYCIVLDYVEGQTLEDLVEKRRKPFPVSYASDLMQQILDALSYAHKRGVIHGDLHTKNVIVANKKANIFDFGKTGTSSEGEPTPYNSLKLYAAKRRKNTDATEKDDIKSAGILFYRLLTGKYPSGLDAPSELNKEVPPEIDRVVKRGLSNYNGYKSADAMLKDLLEAEEAIRERKSLPSKIERSKQFLNKQALKILAATGLMFTLTFGGYNLFPPSSITSKHYNRYQQEYVVVQHEVNTDNYERAHSLINELEMSMKKDTTSNVRPFLEQVIAYDESIVHPGLEQLQFFKKMEEYQKEFDEVKEDVRYGKYLEAKKELSILEDNLSMEDSEQAKCLLEKVVDYSNIVKPRAAELEAQKRRRASQLGTLAKYSLLALPIVGIYLAGVWRRKGYSDRSSLAYNITGSLIGAAALPIINSIYSAFAANPPGIDNSLLSYVGAIAGGLIGAATYELKQDY